MYRGDVSAAESFKQEPYAYLSRLFVAQGGFLCREPLIIGMISTCEYGYHTCTIHDRSELSLIQQLSGIRLII